MRRFRSVLFTGALHWTLVMVLSALPAVALAQRNLKAEPATARAAEGRVALVIGNSAYKDSPLTNPVNDATDIAKALQDAGFKVILKRNAGTRDMRQAIRDFGNELRRAEVGLFYFAGHGMQVRGNNYLLPVGADIQSEADAEDLAIDAAYALRTMEEAQVKISIAILDACRNNPFARSFRSASRGLAQMNAATGSLIAFATAPGSVAADGTGRNGVYTKHLLVSLGQGDTDILKVFQRTRAGVVKETGGKQTPWESTSLVGDFYFRPATQLAGAAPAGAPSAIPGPVRIHSAAEIEQELWDSIKESRDAGDFKEYLSSYPSGRFAPVARARVRTLNAAPAPAATPVSAPVPQQQIASAAPSSVASPLSARPGPTFRDCDVCPEMVTIPAGSFTMGSPDSEAGRYGDESPPHQVTISRSFAAGKYEVTFDEWDACVRESGCGHNPDDAGWGREKRPVVRISWDDAKQYVAWLSRKTGKSYRLLTEAEWEYVARAGTITAFSWGNGISPQQANYDASVSYAGSATGTKQGKTVPVVSYAPNAFGLYDVHGNVWEWVEDCKNANYIGAPNDGSPWTSGDCAQRVLRGGSWYNYPHDLRSANRLYNSTSLRDNSYGLRVARD